MKVVLSIDNGMRYIESADGKVLTGGCLRCGACCVPLSCPHLAYETENGLFVARCKVQHDKPFRCVVWPLPFHEIPDGCGFRYEGE